MTTPQPVKAEQIAETQGRLKQFAVDGRSGNTVYSGGIFCLTGPNSFYTDIRLILTSYEALDHECNLSMQTIAEERDRAEALQVENERLKTDVANQAHSIKLREQEADRAKQTQAHTEKLWNDAEAKALALQAQLSEREGEVARLTREADREEIAHGDTIDQREEAEQAISQAYFLVIGTSPEWSQRVGYEQALDEIDAAQTLLRKSVASAEARANTAEAEVATYKRSWAELSKINADIIKDRDTAETALKVMREALKRISSKGENGLDMWGCRFVARDALATLKPGAELQKGVEIIPPLSSNPRGFCGVEIALKDKPWPGCSWCTAKNEYECFKRNQPGAE